MASKNMMKNTIVLFLTINLVFFGFTMAQAPPPQVAPVCPRSLLQLQTCVTSLPLVGGLLNGQQVAPCCNLVTGLSVDVASVCICNALRLTILDLVIVELRLGNILGLCGFATPPAGFRCA